MSQLPIPGRGEPSSSVSQLKFSSPELLDSAFMKACRKEKGDFTPIWIMRQAGRYMKEFREIRSKTSFLELCKNSSLSCEVTVHAQETLGVDAAIIFADILLPLDALGFGLDYLKGEGPVIARPLRDERALESMPAITAKEGLAYVFEAISQTRQSLKSNIPLIGFAAAPFTLASYLIEGGSSRNFDNTKTMMFRRPDLWHKLMERLVTFSCEYLNEQAIAGAQALQIFDSWVGCLSPTDYEEYVLPHSQKLINGIIEGVPVIHFGTGTTSLLPLMKKAGGDVIGMDWRVDLSASWELLGKIAVQGNLDPCVLLADKSFIKTRAEQILSSVGGKAGHIFNLGHGVLPPTEVDNVKYLVEFVHSYNSK